MLSFVLMVVCLALGCAGACDEREAEQATSDEGAEAGRHGLSDADARKEVARVGDRVITLGDFADRLADQSPYLRARYQSPERKREFLENMIRFELLSLEAKRQGFEKHPQVLAARDKMLVEALLKAEVHDAFPLSSIDEAQIKAYYKAHEEDFRRPEQVRASQIVVRDREQADQLLATLKERPDDDGLFVDLVARHSVDQESKARDGDLLFFGPSAVEKQADAASVPREVVRAAFTLSAVGALHPEPVATKQGYHLIKLTARREAMTRDLDDVRRIIQHKLWREGREARADALVASLRARASVREHPEALKGLSASGTKR